MNKHFVIERYYDSGKTTAEILDYENGCESGYTDGFYEERETYDIYATLCSSYDAALCHAQGVENA
jgi:hypothetical protein